LKCFECLGSGADIVSDPQIHSIHQPGAMFLFCFFEMNFHPARNNSYWCLIL